ncbi:cadherin repeat domain-containing protein [Lacinutrix sp.]|uniref:cadherin repeat domain-containing protein n=1 Tax=Lacinutrix sp. TaxID=1937692 RepID=UPI0025BADEE5|nr:cadherin repeat domain-containing protein [Lacinutrix sp.]
MKTTFKSITCLMGILILSTSCSSDDDSPTVSVPEPTPKTITATSLVTGFDENTVTANQVIGAITATSNSTETVTYAITSQTPSGALSINTSTGEVTIANASLFDYESNGSISATVTASNSEASTTSSITVNVNDISDVIFTHIATADNSSNNNTYLDHSDLNGNPEAKIVINHNWSPNSVYNDNVTGLWYDSTQEKWVIYNEDISVSMVINSAYNVFISKDGDAITHVATDGSFISTIDDDRINNNPDTVLIISNYFNPNGIYNNNNTGVLYDASINKWRIFNQAGTAIPVNAAFNIILKSDNATELVHVTSSASILAAEVQQASAIDDILLNSNPDAKFVITHVADGGVFLDKTLGLYNTGTFWTMFTEDISAMPEGIEFRILVVE